MLMARILRASRYVISIVPGRDSKKIRRKTNEKLDKSEKTQ